VRDQATDADDGRLRGTKQQILAIEGFAGSSYYIYKFVKSAGRRFPVLCGLTQGRISGSKRDLTLDTN
jgi:hypothetical protein